MKLPSRLFAVGLALAAGVTLVLVSTASAEQTPMTDDQIARIRTSCTSTKSTLNQLRTSDTLLRVNRGQLYQSISSKLMERFNNRVAINRYDNNPLTSVSQNYNQAFTTFYNDYRSYETQLASAINIDCTKEPVTFYDAVAAARTKRAQVHADVVKLHQYIDEYKTAVDTFEVTMQTKGNGQ